MRAIGNVMLAVGLALAGLPAAAQGLCGGAGDGGQWIGGTEAASDILTVPAHLEQLALVLAGQEHVSLFRVSTLADIRVEAAGRGAGDPVIDLRNGAGEIILTDDDSGGDGSARGEIALEPGTYCLSLRSYDGSPMTATVRVGLLSHEPLTAGVPVSPDNPGLVEACDIAAAFPMAEGPVDDKLAAGVTVTAAPADRPFLSFQLAGERSLTITADNEQADPRIVLFDEYGAQIAENDDHDGLNALIDLADPLLSGRYCIALSALSDSSLPVTVTVKAYDAVAARLARIARAEVAPPLDGSYPVTALGPLERRLHRDIRTGTTATWFSLDMAEPGLILIETGTDGEGDTALALFDDLGRKVSFNDDSNDTLDSMIAARIMPGTYMVAVWQVGDRADVATRMLIERYAIPQ